MSLTAEYRLFYRALLQKRPVIVTKAPIAFGVPFNLNLQSQSHWSLFIGTWKKRRKRLDHRLRFANEEMTIQMQ